MVGGVKGPADSRFLRSSGQTLPEVFSLGLCFSRLSGLTKPLMHNLPFMARVEFFSPRPADGSTPRFIWGRNLVWQVWFLPVGQKMVMVGRFSWHLHPLLD